MRVRSKLADVEFRFATIEHRENDLPAAWGFFFGFAYFYFRARKGDERNRR